MHVSSNRPVSEDEEKMMMYSPGGPFIIVAPVVTSWAVAGQRMVFLHMYLQTRVTLKAFPVATLRGRSSSSHEGEQFIYGQYIFTDYTEDNVQNTHTYTQYT